MDSWSTCKGAAVQPDAINGVIAPYGPTLCSSSCSIALNSINTILQDTSACPSVATDSTYYTNRLSLLNLYTQACGVTANLTSENGGSCIPGTTREMTYCGYRSYDIAMSNCQSSSFSSCCSNLLANPSAVPTAIGGSSTSTASSSNNMGPIIGGIVAFIVVCVAAVGLVIYYRRRKASQDDDPSSDEKSKMDRLARSEYSDTDTFNKLEMQAKYAAQSAGLFDHKGNAMPAWAYPEMAAKQQQQHIQYRQQQQHLHQQQQQLYGQQPPPGYDPPTYNADVWYQNQLYNNGGYSSMFAPTTSQPSSSTPPATIMTPPPRTKSIDDVYTVVHQYQATLANMNSTW